MKQFQGRNMSACRIRHEYLKAIKKCSSHEKGLEQSIETSKIEKIAKSGGK